MTGSLEHQRQRDLFNPLLIDFIDMQHELVLLADTIDWQHIENELSKYYSKTGRPSIPIRFMVGCLILKRLYNLGDETLAQQWVMNPYFQYFCGMSKFTHKFPCDPSSFVHFRKRIGEEGFNKIFEYSVKIHGKEANEKVVLSDTTVQENNITFPTDAKLAKKIIDSVNRIVKKDKLKQRQSYKYLSKDLLRATHNARHPKRRKDAEKSTEKLKTYGRRLVRELERNLPKELLPKYKERIELYKRVLEQERKSKDKIYSLHKPFTACIAKGKAHKQYEFGNKVGLLVTSKSLIITAIKSFFGNPHDSKTIEPLLEQCKNISGRVPKEVVYDRGGRGRKKIGDTIISTPSKPRKSDSAYQKRKKRKKFRRRAAIEPVIGHLKTDFRMRQNYLHGEESPQINAYLAAIGWNLKLMMRKLKRELLFVYFILQKLLHILFVLTRSGKFQKMKLAF